MRIDVTVEAVDGSRRDVAVLADDATSTPDVVARLADEVCGGQARIEIDGKPVDLTTPWHAQLRTGSILSPSREHRPPDPTARVVVAAGAQAGHVFPIVGRTVVVGRGADCDLVLSDPDVSREHARLTFDATAIHVEDLSSTNGTSVDGIMLRTAKTVVHEHCIIRVGNTALRVELGAPAPPAASVVDAVSWPAQPPRSRPSSTVLASLVTSAVGAVAFGAMTRSVELLMFSLCAPLILGAASGLESLRRTRRARRDHNAYRAALTTAEAELSARGREEAVRLRWTNPDPVELVRRLECGSSAPGGNTTLQVRIGLADRVIDVGVGTHHDPPRAAIAPLAPVALELADGVLRIGGDRDAAVRLIRWILVQICAARPPSRLVVTLILDPERDADWAWTRWLPHLAARPPRRTLGPIDSSAATHVVVVDSAEVAERGDDILRREAGGAAIIMTSSGRPPATTDELHAGESGVLEHCLAGGTTSTSICDGIDIVLAERAARSVAARSTGEAYGELEASALGLVGTPDADEIVSRWARNDGAATSTVGVEDGHPFSIDLCADGPHALVVGTTGSGKSELLQTMVTGLALRYPPNELSLALIDYKGGATFGRLHDLPHVSSVVTDLDHGAASRALLSLQAELRRREALFACAGVDSVSGYRRSGHSPIVPRLVIVVDEFAALVSDQSELLDGLVGVAQRGRSLGVHLVLATQRSAGAIAPDIRTNASLRIALRVEDIAESRELVGSGDAALISSDRPGDAIARTASGLHKVRIARPWGALSASVGAQVVPLGLWRTYTAEHGERETPHLDHVIAIVRDAATKAGVEGHDAPWRPPLPTSLLLTDVGNASEPSLVPFGLADRPERQEQTAVQADLGSGVSLLFAGAPRTGRTTALTTLARSAAARLSPAELSIYVVDASGGGLSAATNEIVHIATACSVSDPTHVARLVQRLHVELKRRQNRPVTVSQVGAKQYRPALLLVDGFDRLTTALDALDAGATSIALGDLITQGPSSGISVAMTADLAATAVRFAPAFSAVFAMGAHASDALCRRGASKSRDALPPGRGTRMSDGAAVQIAMAVDNQAANCWDDAPVADDRIIVRPLPASVTLESIAATPGGFVLGLGGDEATPVVVDLVRHQARLLVSGPPASGKSTTLIALLSQAMSMGLPVAVAAGSRSPLAAVAADFGLSAVSPDETHPPIDCEAGLLLIDDVDQFVDTNAEGALTAVIRSTRHACAVIASGDATNLSLLQRGAAAELRRSRTGLLLQPRTIDGDLFAIRIPRSAPTSIAGRGLLVPDPMWFPARRPISIQIAVPATYTYPMCG